MAKLLEFASSSFTGGGRLFGQSTAKKVRDPLGLIKSKPKIVKTAEEQALEKRQRSLLDKEIEKSEERFAALARGKLGRVSLLSGAPKTVEEAARGGPRGGTGAGSLLGAAARRAGRVDSVIRERGR